MSDVIAVPLGTVRPVSSPFRAGFASDGTGARMVGRASPRADDYSRGYADALAETDAAAGQDMRAADQIRDAISQLRAEPSEELGLYIAEAVSHIVRQIVGETPVAAEEILRRAHAAAALIADNDAATAVRLHPEDAALVGPSVGAIAVIPEPGLLRGDILVECAAGTIEDGNALRLAALDVALGLGGHA